MKTPPKKFGTASRTAQTENRQAQPIGVQHDDSSFIPVLREPSKPQRTWTAHKRSGAIRNTFTKAPETNND